MKEGRNNILLTDTDRNKHTSISPYCLSFVCRPADETSHSKHPKTALILQFPQLMFFARMTAKLLDCTLKSSNRVLSSQKRFNTFRTSISPFCRSFVGPPANETSHSNHPKTDLSCRFQTNALHAPDRGHNDSATFFSGRSREIYTGIPTRTSFRKLIAITLNNPRNCARDAFGGNGDYDCDRLIASA
ncbi:hypothetical protein CDAR_169921 [Caerostris darwini]|uniref:Uncharacterized protein n=1 Tax=Caerostris darwini TaxID=1538125 RepID=A0AAV4RHX2_9ARAC|nr:hypothetical protein CDAR_169921 [Caerostris darwini]